MGPPLIVIPLVFVLIAILSVQGGASIAKSLFPVLGAETVSMLRLGFSALMLLVFWQPWKTRVTRSMLVWIAAYGLVLGAMNLSFYLSLTRIPLGVAVTLEFIGPLAVALFASRKILHFVWALFAMAGLALIAPWHVNASSLDPVGVAFGLGAGVAWGLYIVIGKRASARAPAGVVTSIGMIFAFLVVLPFGLVASKTGAFTPRLLLFGLGVAFLSSALPYSLEMLAMKKMSSRSFGLLMSLEPAVAALMGLFVLGEMLNARQWLALVCIIVASAGSSLISRDEVALLPED